MAAEKELIKTKAFVGAISVPLMGWFIASMCIWHFDNQWLDFDLSSAGFSQYLSSHKFPLGVLALIFPSVALVAANHRSVQQAAIYKATQSQNVFANSTLHREKFNEWVEKVMTIEFMAPHLYENSIIVKGFLRRSWINEIYQKLFPKASTGDFSIDRKVARDFDTVLSELYEAIEVEENEVIARAFRDVYDGFYPPASYFDFLAHRMIHIRDFVAYLDTFSVFLNESFGFSGESNKHRLDGFNFSVVPELVLNELLSKDVPLTLVPSEKLEG